MIDTKRKTIIITVGGLTTELINTHSQPWSVRMEERDGLRCGSVDWWLAHPLGTPSFGVRSSDQACYGRCNNLALNIRYGVIQCVSLVGRGSSVVGVPL